MRILAALLCATVVSSAPVPPGLLSKALEVKNWVKAGGVASFLSGLKVFNEEAAAREDERQDEKQTLRDKAKATANYVVWYHLDLEERESGTTNRCEFEQMIKAAKPIMKKKLRRRGNFLARLLTSTPSPQLAEIYVREEIVKKMQDKGIKMLDGDAKFEKTDACDKDTNESKWPTIFAGGKVDKVETVKPVKAELKALEAPEETPKEKKLVKRVLIAIASAALVTVLPFG